MVQKYKSPTRTYKYPFELVMAAYERRFPTCDMIPVLVSTDIIKEDKSDDGSTHVIERRCKLNVDAPYLLKKVAGVEYFYCIQRNTLDRRSRTLQIEAWNESFAKKIVINEFCRYFVHPDHDDWTCFEQTASLEVKSFFSFESAVEKLAVKLYAQSIEKGKEIIEMHVTQLKSEGINYVEPFKCVNNRNGDGENCDIQPSNGIDTTTTTVDNCCKNKFNHNSRQNSAKHKNNKHKLDNNCAEAIGNNETRCEKCCKLNNKSLTSPSTSVDKSIGGSCNHTLIPSVVATSSSSLESTKTTSSFASSTTTVANCSGTDDSTSLNNGSSDECVINSSTTMVTSSSQYYSS